LPFFNYDASAQVIRNHYAVRDAAWRAMNASSSPAAAIGIL
jgi:hypothetical protein